MEVKITKSEKDFMEFEVKGEDHTLANIIRKELWNVKGVKEASYNIKHPLISALKISVRSEGKPKKAIAGAVSNIKAQVKELRALVKKI
jgi:DNA-directed RNA polymerase subunit L